jgi:Tfp pilus assembly protein PilZ
MDERREHTRITVTLAVKMTGDRAAVIWATMEDLSRGGAFIKTSQRLAIGVPVEIIVVAEEGPTVVLPGVVCRHTERGVGVRWSHLAPREASFLAGMLAALHQP